jgi:hypothetical protein
LDTTTKATDNGVKQSLAIVRDAIELFAAENGGKPGADGLEATFKSDLDPYLRGQATFPTCPVEANNDAVKMVAGLAPITGDPAPVQGWAYAYETGQFIVNSNAPTESDPTKTYDSL